jgi:large conductance mechanosensitive channel
MIREFRDFIAKGNAMDLAVGIIIGAAFTAIVNSIVADLINPVIGVVTGGIDFSNLFFVLGDGEYANLAAAREAGVPVFAYGAFLTAVIEFLIIAFVVFLLVKAINRIKDAALRKGQEVPSAPKGPTQEELLTDIRNLLASGDASRPPANAASPTMPG